MALNKKAEVKTGTIVLVVGLLLIGAYLMNVGGFKDTVNGFIQPSNTGGNTGGSSGLTPTTTANCPSTGLTSLTINVQDDLASTATNVNAEYYIFNGNKLIKESTTGADGTDTISLTCGQDFKILLVNTTAGNGNGLYAQTFDYQARISSDSVNKEMTVFGTAKILGIENPADPSRNANVSIVAGQTKNFELKFAANHSARGFNKPIILCQVNKTGIKEVTTAKTFSDGKSVISASVPDRVSATSNYRYYAFGYPDMVTPSMGVVSISGSLVAQDSVAPSITDSMTCIIADQATWKTSSYKTSTSPETGFMLGAENTETLADTGGPDAASASYYFVNIGGY